MSELKTQNPAQPLSCTSELRDKICSVYVLS